MQAKYHVGDPVKVVESGKEGKIVKMLSYKPQTRDTFLYKGERTVGYLVEFVGEHGTTKETLFVEQELDLAPDGIDRMLNKI